MAKRSLRHLLGGESGQATTEYILVMAISVSLGLLIIKQLLKPVIEKMTATLNKMIEKGLTKGLHDAKFVRKLMR